jgi:hypothetical protein
MTGRDTFAAAALTGLLSSMQKNVYAEEMASHAYDIADAMLRERGRTNHDAVPEACVQQSTRVPERSLLAQSESVERGLPRTGNTQEPVAWAVIYPTGDAGVLCFFRRDAEERATASDRVVPLYRSPTLTDEEREAIIWCVELLDELESSKGDALRSLLERMK